jgi:hypothetical protein
MVNGSKIIMVSYDPSDEWDKHCDMQNKAEREYIEENRDKQDYELNIFMERLINFWNKSYLRANKHSFTSLHLDHLILLCFYILEQMSMDGYFVDSDKLYSILDTFPETKALEYNFLFELEKSIDRLKSELEKE